MSKSKVHLLIPYTTKVLCGTTSFYEVNTIREYITCPLCKKHPEFKKAMTLKQYKASRVTKRRN